MTLFKDFILQSFTLLLLLLLHVLLGSLFGSLGTNAKETSVGASHTQAGESLKVLLVFRDDASLLLLVHLKRQMNGSGSTPLPAITIEVFVVINQMFCTKCEFGFYSSHQKRVQVFHQRSTEIPEMCHHLTANLSVFHLNTWFNENV